MAYPPGVTQATITVGTAIGWFGEPVTKLSASITPVLGGNATQLVHRATGTTMYVTSKTWTDDGTGIVTFTLPHVDQPGWFDGVGKETTNWAYKANITATFAGGNQRTRSIAFQVFSDQDEVDLDLIEDGQISAPVGAVVPAVTSINGKTGAITLEELGGYDDTALVERVQALEERPTGGVSDDTIQLLRAVEPLKAQVDRVSRKLSSRRHISYPSYRWASFYQTDPNLDPWAKTLADPESIGFVILNPNSGPGEEVNADWQTQADMARGSGATVLGYVSTDYANAGIARDGSRTHEKILEEAAQHVEWYGVDGIFLDEMSNGWSDAQANDHIWYQELAAKLRAAHPGILLVGNSGTNTRRAYAELSDVLVTFEKSAAEYLEASAASLTPPDYRGLPASKFWHMIHDVESNAQALEVLEKASKSNVGHLYLTDDTNAHEPPAMWGNPYDVPPSPWLLELQRAWTTSRPVAVTSSGAAPKALDRKNRVSIVGDSFSSRGYGSNFGHIWHTVALSRADGALIGNYAENGHTVLDALEGRTAQWGPDLANAQVTRAVGDASQSVIICLGYNDQNNGVSKAAFLENMTELVRRVTGAGKRAIIVQPPIPIRARAAAIPELRDYLSGLQNLADSEGAVYVPTWDLIGDDRGLSDLWDQGDGSHMTSAGHDAIGRVIAPRLQQAIGGLGPFAAATRTPRPLTDATEVMNDAVSTATVVKVPESSLDLFPSGQAYLMDLGATSDAYISLGVPYRTSNLGGKLLRFTFSYEIVSMPEDKVRNDTASAGLHAQAGTFNPWLFSTVWGGVKLEGTRGVASVVTRVKEGADEWVYALTLLGVNRTEEDAPAQVRVGAGRIEEVQSLA